MALKDDGEGGKEGIQRSVHHRDVNGQEKHNGLGDDEYYIEADQLLRLQERGDVTGVI